jgi:S-adenosylmethionine hydrolase
MKPSGIITFLSDFGTSDWFTAAVKGEIHKRNRHAVIVDVTHAVRPHDIRSAAFILTQYYMNYPEGTVHLLVVDPGVGSMRRGIAVESEEHIFIAPDNGVLSCVLDDAATVYQLPVPEHASATFHGRDVFGPAAGVFSLGTPITYPKLDTSTCTRVAFSRFNGATGSQTGEVIYIDRFGNCITNIPATAAVHEMRVNDVYIPVVSCYTEGDTGTPVAVKGSSGFYEISVNQGNAQQCMGIAPGTPVIITR